MAKSAIKEAPKKTFPFKVEMDLTEKERLAYVDELGRIEDELDESDHKLQSAKGQHKTDTERLTGRHKVVMNFLRTKKEHKPVECFLQFNYIEGLADYVRLDTGEVVNTRRMTSEEYRGTPLFDDQEIQEVEAAGEDVPSETASESGDDIAEPDPEDDDG